jgi:hypothetical protein
LQPFPDSEAKTMLLRLVNFSIERKYWYGILIFITPHSACGVYFCSLT